MTLQGWVPVAVTESSVDWRLLPGHDFTHPFFEDTLRRNRGALAQTTGFEAAEEWVAAHPGMAPDGLVFHMSRCGSTLVAQMLAAVDENRVMAEAPAIDDVLRQHSAARLRTIVGALGQLAEAETRYFLKLDCWHIRHYELIREAFPDTPAVFLYRDPLEVLVSQMRNPGKWTAEFGADRVARIAEMLGGMMEAAIRHSLYLVAYTELPEAVLGMFGIEWSEAQREKMRIASTRDAKSPRFKFVSDSEEKQAAASAEIREAARGLAELYEQVVRASRPARCE